MLCTLVKWALGALIASFTSPHQMSFTVLLMLLPIDGMWLRGSPASTESSKSAHINESIANL